MKRASILIALVAIIGLAQSCKTSKNNKTVEEKKEVQQQLAATTKGTVYDLYISSKTARCQGVIEQTCLLVRKKPTDEWEYFYDAIEGFEHQEGTDYHIEVERRAVKDIPADGSAYTYHLVKIKSQGSAPITSLVGKWRIESLEGRKIKGEHKEPYMTFDTKRMVDMNAGCNQMQLPYTMDSRQRNLTFDTKRLVSTRMACKDNTEQEFIRALARVSRYEIGEGQIFLISGRQTLIVLSK